MIAQITVFWWYHELSNCQKLTLLSVSPSLLVCLVWKISVKTIKFHVIKTVYEKCITNTDQGLFQNVLSHTIFKCWKPLLHSLTFCLKLMLVIDNGCNHSDLVIWMKQLRKFETNEELYEATIGMIGLLNQLPKLFIILSNFTLSIHLYLCC